MRKTKIKSNPEYIQETKLLDYNSPLVKGLVSELLQPQMETKEKVKVIYEYVRDQIAFGYNEDDQIPASQVLKDGYGQCNTKSTLLMALFRAAGLPCRIHGFTIDKALQKGAIKGIWYRLAGREILHSWVEVKVDSKWYFLEGVILDKPYLNALQAKFPECKTTFCGYGAYTNSFEKPEIEWNLNHTYIQAEGIVQDFGVFDDPDTFYTHHSQGLSAFKQFLFRNLVRHIMNRNVQRIRKTE